MNGRQLVTYVQGLECAGIACCRLMSECSKGLTHTVLVHDRSDTVERSVSRRTTHFSSSGRDTEHTTEAAKDPLSQRRR